jgi:riboflavin kinase/FMN adenylyltransferase
LIPLRSPQEALRPTAIALGSFDGLHQGHRRVIAAVTAAAGNEAAAIPTVVSFWPHPREVLHGEARLRLDLPAEKLHLLEPLGIEQLVLVPFSRELAALSPEAFVEQVLVGQLAAQRVAFHVDDRLSGHGLRVRRAGGTTWSPLVEVSL